VPPLLSFFNQAFAGVLVSGEGGPRPYEVVYEPAADDLKPVRPAPLPPPVVERLLIGEAETTSELRALDADGVARWLRTLLAPDAAPCVAAEDGTGLRQARGGDVAMLFRTFPHLEVYRQALIRHGVPHRVLRGRGFYGAQEVLDLASLLALLADPDDVLAFAAVLRSPLVGLSDASLFRMAGPEGLSLSSPRLHDLEALELPVGERARLERFLTVLPALRRERDRIGVRALLQVALDATGYREALAGSPYAEQASANVDKLLALAARRDERGTGGCVAFARELQRLADSNPTEAQADLLEAGDPRAVQLLTIHRAKGLEWPVVVVPALGGRRRNISGRALFERTHGLSLRPWLPEDLGAYSSERFERVKAELKSRETAEYRRLLYVALTRARDRLVLSGAAEPRSESDTWWKLLDKRLEEDTALRELVQDVDVQALPLPAELPAPTEADADVQESRVEAALRRVRAATVPPTPTAVVVSAGALRDFMACPRRYRLVHRLGLRVEGVPWEVPPCEAQPYVEREAWSAAPSLSGRMRMLLRGVDFRLAEASASEQRAHLESLARDAGWALEEEGVSESFAAVERFLGTPFARRLAAAPVAHLHRAQPFVLHLPGEAPASVEGEVDLLWETSAREACVVAYAPGRRHPMGAAALASELEALRLAARRLVKEGVPVQVGVAFLGEPSPEPEFLPASKDLEGTAEQLRASARALVEADVGGRWPGREKAICLALACGYSEHCHPAPRAC
jgi:ATP-dependent exoDNAse (exonuclease V) beta subunit